MAVIVHRLHSLVLAAAAATSSEWLALAGDEALNPDTDIQEPKVSFLVGTMDLHWPRAAAMELGWRTEAEAEAEAEDPPADGRL